VTFSKPGINTAVFTAQAKIRGFEPFMPFGFVLPNRISNPHFLPRQAPKRAARDTTTGNSSAAYSADRPSEPCDQCTDLHPHRRADSFRPFSGHPTGAPHKQSAQGGKNKPTFDRRIAAGPPLL